MASDWSAKAVHCSIADRMQWLGCFLECVHRGMLPEARYYHQRAMGLREWKAARILRRGLRARKGKPDGD